LGADSQSVWKGIMITATETTLTLEVTSPRIIEQAAGRRSRQAKFQFWCSTIISGSLLLAGAWLLDGAKGPESAASAIMGNAAVTIWLCLPTCIYFAWQGYRKMRGPESEAVENADSGAELALEDSSDPYV
jgi:hypothetical protein